MNQPVLSVIAIAILLSASCKEKDTLINMSGAKATDTTYMAGVEAQQNRVVLIEEFTGGNCSNCPRGHRTLYDPNGIKAQHPKQVAVIAYHFFGMPLAEPVHGEARYDLRTEDATNVGKTIFGGISGIPGGVVDRKTDNNAYLLDPALWPAKVNTEVSIKPAANLYITSDYNASTRKVTARIKVAYTQRVSKKQSLALAIIENNIIDAQKDEFVITKDYTHKSVLRDIITQFYGDAMIDSIATKEAGRVYERTFSFNIDAAWKVENCQLVAFVHNNEGADKEVIQAAEVDLQ